MVAEVFLFSCALIFGKKIYRKITGEREESKTNKEDSRAGKDSFMLPSQDTLQKAAITHSAKEKRKKTEFEKIVDKSMILSGGAIGMAAAGALWFPPLSIISGVLSFYTCIPMFKIAKDSVMIKKFKKIELLDSIAVIATLKGGFFLAYSLTPTPSFTIFRGCLRLLKRFSCLPNKKNSIWLLQPSYLMGR